MHAGSKHDLLEHGLPSPSERVFGCTFSPAEAREPSHRPVNAELPPLPLDPLEAMFSNIAFRDYTGRPRIVLAEKPVEKNLSYIEFLARILYELMRTYWRAPMPFQTMFVSQRLTEYQLANMRPGMGIYIVDLDALREKTSDEATFARFTRTISDRLHEAFSQWIGYLVLYGRDDSLSLIRKLWEPRVIARRVVYASLPPYVEIRLGVHREQLLRLISLFYGEVPGLEEADTVSQAVARAEDAYFTSLELVANDPFISLYNRLAVDEEEARQDAAFIHFALKSAAIKYLMDIGIDPSALSVESIVANVPIDIRVERGWGSSIAVEVETLYGVGNPVSRLSTVIRERVSLGYSVWIVLPPTQALIFAPYIRGLMRHFAERVEFYTFDTAKGSLKSLTEYYETIDKALRDL